MLQEITTGITTTTTGIVKEKLVRKIPQKMEPFTEKAFTGKIYKPKLEPMNKLKYAHPLVLRLFQNHSIGNFPLAGRLKKISEKLEKSYKQSRDSQDCFRMKNRFPRRALTNQTPSPGKNVKGGGLPNRRGSESYVGEMCCSKG